LAWEKQLVDDLQMLLHGQLSGASFDDLKQEFTALTTDSSPVSDRPLSTNKVTGLQIHMSVDNEQLASESFSETGLLSRNSL
jgi:hypothetical protein